MSVCFMQDGEMLLLHNSSVLFMDNLLMVFMNVLLNDNWLMVLVNDLLMMLMYDVLLVLHNHILVVLVDYILVDFFHNGSISVSPDVSSQLMPFNGLSFIALLVDCLFLMGDYYWFLINLFHNHLATSFIVSSLDVSCTSMSKLSTPMCEFCSAM